MADDGDPSVDSEKNLEENDERKTDDEQKILKIECCKDNINADENLATASDNTQCTDESVKSSMQEMDTEDNNDKTLKDSEKYGIQTGDSQKSDVPKVFVDEILKNDDGNSEPLKIFDEGERVNLSENTGTGSDDPQFGEERFRVDRKKLETLIQDEERYESREHTFFHQIEKATNTKISWPPKLKIGAKSKKDPYIKVAGLPEDRQSAKQMVLSVMDTKSTRVTLKMDVSFADHSHIIGKGGNTISAVMKNTQCHIHFPDSNRTSSEKSNQVSIAGPPYCVESARRQIRELLPIVLKFEIPPSAVTVPDSSSPVIVNIAQTYKVTITFQQQLRSYGFIGCVKGLHADPFSVRDAILKILEHLTGTVPVTVPVTTQIEIDPKHHIFVGGRNAVNINKIRQATGACIQFPDPHDPTTRKSTVIITGTIESAVTAKVYLLQYLPLILMFDIRDGDNDNMLEPGILTNMMDKSDVHISVKPKPRQFCKSIIIKGHEKNAHNIYKTRLHLIGENSANMPYLMTPLATLVIPQINNPMHLLSVANVNGQMIPPVAQPPPVTCMSNQSSPLSPPVESSSPLERQQSPEKSTSPKPNPSFMRVSPVGQRIIGSEMKMKRLSVDALLGNVLEEKETLENESKKRSSSTENLSSSRNGESMLNNLMGKTANHSDVAEQVNKEIQLALSGSFNQQPSSKAMMPIPQNHMSMDSGLSQSQEDLNNMSLTQNLINNVSLQQNNNKFGTEEYELRKQMAKNAMHSQVSGKVRTPTSAWSGLGFSNSMPEAVIKELWNNREKRSSQRANGIQTNHSPTTSLDSSVSSNGSSTSHGLGHQSPAGSKAVRPPPGLEDSHPSMSNAFLNNNFEYNSVLSPSSSEQIGNMNLYSNINCIADLFTKLGLEQYIEAFEKEEVDLSTFLSLTDDDLKELGVATFGARKKMTNVMKDLQSRQQMPYSNQMTQSPHPGSFSNGLFPSVRPTTHSLDIAAHSLRW